MTFDVPVRAGWISIRPMPRSVLRRPLAPGFTFGFGAGRLRVFSALRGALHLSAVLAATP
ncbi:hypothetical protein [Tateyamaria sp. ANG-S1]|uniref:hypothetical protein n=1 Tax=Tateyamaria sp. ANG-S1 TaxID=1577905 RepID=UPI001269A1E7|nr:hypothetical protein [Tateyamaria sp. ANG-S1]